jgi:hypothetical protein
MTFVQFCGYARAELRGVGLLVSIRKTKIRGVEVDADLAKEVFNDDVMDEMAKDKGTETISFKSLIAVFGMFVPAMVGVMITALSAMWLELLKLIGNYTVLELLNFQLAFYISAPMGIMLSIVIYFGVRTWAQSSFEGVVVLRIVGRNPSGSKTVHIDYMGQIPKPMKKPTINELGAHFGAYLKEQVAQLHRGIPEEEIKENLDRMQQRLALAYRKQMEKAEAQKMKTVSQRVEVIVKDEFGNEVIDPATGKPKTEEIDVQVPVFRPKFGRRRRVIMFILGLAAVAFSLWGISFMVFLATNGAINIWEFLFGWIPWL